MIRNKKERSMIRPSGLTDGWTNIATDRRSSRLIEMRERVLTKPFSEKLNNRNETSSKPSPLVAAIPLYFFLSSSVGRNRSKMSTYSGLSEALSRLFMALQRRSLAKFMRFFEIAKFLRWKTGFQKWGSVYFTSRKYWKNQTQGLTMRPPASDHLMTHFSHYYCYVDKWTWGVLHREACPIWELLSWAASKRPRLRVIHSTVYRSPRRSLQTWDKKANKTGKSRKEVILFFRQWNSLFILQKFNMLQIVAMLLQQSQQ